MSERPPGPPVEWFLDGTIDRRKFDLYLLSETHREGRHKARLWRSVFGIGPEDADLLEALIRQHLPQAKPDEKEEPHIGTSPERLVRRWELIIPHFLGPNGHEGAVLTAWALTPDASHPHLTTAYPLV
jgi:hypothetical protein